jgi:hypothetical protein
MMKTDRIGVILFVLLLVFVAGSGCVDIAVNQTTSNNGSAVVHTQKEHSPFQSNTDPNTVPIETAYNLSLAAFWSFTIDGPYSSDPNWTSAALDPEPVILYDINGKPQYYEFYLRNGGTIPGYFWTGANKLMDHGVFRLYQGAPSYNHSQIAQDAEKIVKTRYPDYPILSNTPALYSGGYPHLCAMVTIRNTSSGANERIIVDAFTHEIVPDHPSEDYKGHEYAWSYLDSIPQSEYITRIAQWELQDSNASRMVEYAMAQGIDVQLPLTPQNASIIRNYPATASPGPSSPEPDRTSAAPDARPVTDELIGENVVPVETARDHALVVLWRIVIDRPDNFASRSWRNASLIREDPAIIEDFEGRKLYYVFGVERNGVAVSDIIVAANKGLYSHPWGLETPAGEYDFVNATQKAREKAAQDFPGDSVLSIRPVYSLADNCCHNVTMMMEVENPQTYWINRILIDTYTLNSSVETVTGTMETDAYPSLFSVVTPGDFADNTGRWVKADEQVRNVTGFAKRSGISPDRALSDKEIIALGTYIFKSEPRYQQEGGLYNPLYPQPAIRPTLDKATQVWHEQADWFSAILVDASLDKVEIEQIIKSHSIPGNYTIRILSSGAMGADYYLDVPVPDYNRTFSILEQDGSVGIREQVAAMWEYVQIVKRKNGSIIIPLGIAYPEEGNAKRLIATGVPLKPMREVYIQYDYTAMPKKAEREKALAELNADDRVLFAFREYSS